jgi:hypothetical protein
MNLEPMKGLLDIEISINKTQIFLSAQSKKLLWFQTF